MRHRVFVAIILPSEIKRILLSIISGLKRLKIPVRWVTENNLHLSVRFLDSRTEREIEEIHEKLKTILRNKKLFTLALKEVKLFPSQTQAKVIAAKLSRSNKLEKLTQEINQGLDKLEFLKKENRSFKSHITLARIKVPLDKNITEKIEKINIKGHWSVGNLYLMESDLSEKIPLYQVRQYYSLKV